MYEDMTFENIMDRCLDRVSSSIDKREGSVVYDAIAPAAAELAIMYIELAYLMDRAFPDTESGDDLTEKVRERSIFRTPATAAIRKGYFEDGNGAAMDVPIGTRFSGDNLNYTVTEKIATGQFRLLCETPGAAGNQYQGNLFPIDYVEGLGAARLADILINGEDEESDEDLLDRYMDSLQAQAYGGNKADYKTKVELLQGVGAVKVFPVWNGGGTVKIVFVNSDWGIPSSDLVNSVQTAVDPVQNQGVGDGIAPIGHVVTVEGVTGTTINVSFTLTFSGFGHLVDRRNVCEESYSRTTLTAWPKPRTNKKTLSSASAKSKNEGPGRRRRDRHHRNQNQRRNTKYSPGFTKCDSGSGGGDKWFLKNTRPRYLQELIEFQQIANAEQPEFENAVSDVKSAADDFFWCPCPNMGANAGKRFWGFLRRLGTQYRTAATES